MYVLLHITHLEPYNASRNSQGYGLSTGREGGKEGGWEEVRRQWGEGSGSVSLNSLRHTTGGDEGESCIKRSVPVMFLSNRFRKVTSIIYT